MADDERIYLGSKDQITEILDTDAFVIVTGDGIRKMTKAQVMEKLGISELKDTTNQLSEEIEDMQSGGTGLSDAEKNLILTLFQNAVFTTDQSGNIEALYNLFNKTVVEVTGIVLSASSLNMTTADSETLTATLRPSGATGLVAWKSSNNSVATVSQTGMVTPVGNGSCIITASVGESLSASCTVNVDLSSVIDITQDGSTLTIIKASKVTQEDSTLVIE